MTTIIKRIADVADRLLDKAEAIVKAGNDELAVVEQDIDNVAAIVKENVEKARAFLSVLENAIAHVDETLTTADAATAANTDVVAALTPAEEKAAGGEDTETA